jgi:hypothetical protein
MMRRVGAFALLLLALVLAPALACAQTPVQPCFLVTTPATASPTGVQTQYCQPWSNSDYGNVVVPGTASVNGLDQTNYVGRGLVCVVNITALTGTSVTFTIQGKDNTNGIYYTLLASTGLTGTGTTVLTVYPGIAATTNVAASAVVPRVWRVITTDVALTALTATVDCNVIL